MEEDDRDYRPSESSFEHDDEALVEDQDSPVGTSEDESQDEASSLRAQLAAERQKVARLQQAIGEQSEESLPALPAFRRRSKTARRQRSEHATRTPDLAKVLNKPPTYNGSPSSDLRLWLTIMAAILTAIQLPYPLAVATAVSYLIGDAAKFWHSHAPKLTQLGMDTSDWKVFKKALYERFGYKNAEHAARDRLHSLEQRNMSYAQYVNAFDDCNAHIPNYDEADKVHRFLRGLRPNLRNRLCINPVTFKRWTRYNAMVAYGHNLMNEGDVSGPPADIIADVSAAHTRSTKRPAANHSADRSTKKPKTFQASDAHSRDGLVRAESVEGGKQFTVVRSDGSRFVFVRDNHIAAYCMRKHLCAHCYKPGHTPNHCRSNQAAGDPPAPFDRNFKRNQGTKQG